LSLTTLCPLYHRRHKHLLIYKLCGFLVMKILFSDFKKGDIRFRITAPEDLWYLSQVVDVGDILGGKTIRKVTIGGGDEKSSHSQRTVSLSIDVERVVFEQSVLRVSGKITTGPEDIPRGSYHTFSLDVNTECSLHKGEWLSYQRTQLDEAVEASHESILICVFDRDDAIIALSKPYGYDVLTTLRGDPSKKEARAITKQDFYPSILKAIVDYDKRHKPRNIIVASPAFYKEDLVAQITDTDLKKKIVLATCSSAREDAIGEVMKRPETRSALQQVRVADETKIVDSLLAEISKDGNVTYGFDHVMRAAEAGAITDVLVTDLFITEFREAERFKELNALLRLIDQMKGKVHIISVQHDAGKRLHGLGGVGALLRYKLQ
jgi:protein pelota